MVWARFDDQTPEHPKLVELGDLAPLAGYLWFAATCYACRYLTDGQVTRAQLERLWPFKHIGVETGGVPGLFAVGEDADADWLIKALVSVGLLEENGDGNYRIHDFLHYNPSRAAVMKARRNKAKAGQAGGQASAQASAQARAMASASEGIHSPSLSPSPSVKKEKKENESVSLRETARVILRFLNEKTGKSFRPTEANLGFVLARLRTGATEQDCRAVIARKVRQWKGDPKMHEFLRPKTLFNATNFESYIGEAAPEPTA